MSPLPNRHQVEPHADPAECVFISAATAVGASKYWYCEGSDLHDLTPVYSGKSGGTSDVVRRYKAITGHTFRFPPPSYNEIAKEMKKGEMLAIPVPSEETGTKGFLLLQRPALRDFEEGPVPFTNKATKEQMAKPRNESGEGLNPGKFVTDEDIATFIVSKNARFIDPKPGETAREPSAAEQLEFLRGLNDLFLKALEHKHHVTYEHIINMTQLVKKSAEEMNLKAEKLEASILEGEEETRRLAAAGDIEAILACVKKTEELKEKKKTTFKITPENLEILTLLASLHDIGKYQVPNSLLDDDDIKSKPLQWAIMQKHVADGRDILDVPLIDRRLAVIISSHHMQPNGEGYPYAGTYDSQGRISFRGREFPDTDRQPGNPATVRLPLEVGFLHLCDQFEAATGTRKRIDPRAPSPSPATVLEAMLPLARHQKINPYIFDLFVKSQALTEYCSNPGYKHFEQSPAETGRMVEIKDKIDRDDVLKELAEQYGLFAESMLFTPLDPKRARGFAGRARDEAATKSDGSQFRWHH